MTQMVRLLSMTSINPGAGEHLDDYMGVVGPLMQAAGAKVVSRFELSDTLAGSTDIEFVTLLEYPDEESVRSVFDSEEYKSLDEVKRLAFSRYEVNKATMS